MASAARTLAIQLGFYTGTGSGFSFGNLTPQQQITHTNALAAYVTAHPALFDTGAPDLTNPVNSAPYAQNQNIADASYSGAEAVDAFLSSARAVNPLDPQNFPTIGKYLLGAAVVLGVVYIILKTRK